MGSRRWLGGHQPDPAPELAAPAPGQEVREYRMLLRTLPPEDLVELHRRALLALDPLARTSILRSTEQMLAPGASLAAHDARYLARVLVAGEQNSPGVILSTLDEVALERLARLVLVVHRAPPPDAQA